MQKSISGSLTSSIVDDKVFMNKFIILLSMIIALSVYIILGASNSFDSLSNVTYTKSHIVTLDDIERKINGNLVNLDIVEDDFSQIVFADLSIIENESVKVSSTKIEQINKDIIKSKPIVAKIVNKDIVKSKPIIAKVVNKSEKKRFYITSQVSSSAIKSNSKSLSFMKKKFYASNSSTISLDIAKKFYTSKNYKKALKWSLITNEIDTKSEQSWIMFANVKNKMGKTKDAVSALSHYLKSNDSKKVKNLLATLKAKV